MKQELNAPCYSNPLSREFYHEKALTSAAETMQTENIRIAPLEESDLPSLLTVERQSNPFPWTAAQFQEELANPVSSVAVLWKDQQLAGYICSWLIAGEMQILNIATAKEFRRQGIAGKLLEHAFSSARKAGLSRAWLEVRAGNGAAIALYQRYRFVADVVRSGYYRDGEDALVMVRDF